MGLPQTIINFQTLAQTLIRRTQNGIVALLIKDDTANKPLYTYNSPEQVVSTDLWSDANIALIKSAFIGGARRVYVARVGASVPTLNTALGILGNKQWDYLAYPDGVSGDMTTISDWIKLRRNTDKKTYKAVLGGVAADHEGIINLTTVGITDQDGNVFDNIKFSARIAGILAGVGTESSVTNYQLAEIESITDLADDTARDTAINNGELILINDGERVVIARGVNSLKTTTSTKGDIFKKIRIVEIIDTMRDDITTTINLDYRGKVLNTYNNKLLLAGAINTYFGVLQRENVLDPEFENKCVISLEQTRAYLQSIGIDTDSMSDEQVLRYNTNDKVFLDCNIKTIDAMEDFVLNLYL